MLELLIPSFLDVLAGWDMVSAARGQVGVCHYPGLGLQIWFNKLLTSKFCPYTKTNIWHLCMASSKFNF